MLDQRRVFLQQLNEFAQKDRQSHQYTRIYTRKINISSLQWFIHIESGDV